MADKYRVTPAHESPVEFDTYPEAASAFVGHVNNPACAWVDLFEIDTEKNWAMELCRFSRER